MADEYLIWSNEHRAWWAVGHMGYSPGLSRAGVYSRAEALRICRDAIPTAGNIGLISEIPVRRDDIYEFLEGQVLPKAIVS
jgi:hypothetical protein